MHATLINKHTEEVKHVKVGFSWTEFFWGFWPTILRADWKWFIIIVMADLCLGVFTWGGGSLFFNFIFGFFYNKLYINDLLNVGYEPIDKLSYNILLAKNYIYAGSKFTTVDEDKI